MKKPLTLLVTFVLLLTTIGCPMMLASASELSEITVENTARRTYALSSEVSDNETDYTFIAASYRSDNTLVGVELVSATVEEGVASATVNLSSATYAKEAEETRFMLWNMDETTPLAYAESKTYPATDVASGKYVGGVSSGTDNTFITTKDGSKLSRAIVDNDDSTYNGYYGTTTGNMGYMYIDLGMSYPIDRIEVLGYTDNEDYSRRGGSYTVAVGNQKPTLTAPFAEDAVAGELVVATAEETVVTDNNFRKTIYMPADSEPQRFVSLEKLYENSYGLLIADVKVYVLDEDIPTPVEYVEVASGKTTGGWCDDSGAYNFSHNPTANLVDGNEDTMAGFYYNIRTGYMYIDLGTAYQIDHIEVLAYDTARPRNCGNYDLILNKDVPDQTAYDSANPGNQLLVEHVAYDGNTIHTDNGYKRFDLPSTVDEYRYVSLEKFADDGGTNGLVIREVKVYVKPENMPATNVALGRGAIGYTTSTDPTVSGCTDPAVITDGQVCIGGNSQQYILGLPSWYCLDLGQSYDIEKVLIDCVASTATQDFGSNINIYLSAEPAVRNSALPANMTTILDGAANTTAWESATKTITLDTPVTARYVIVHRTASGVGGTTLRIGELEVWGK